MVGLCEGDFHAELRREFTAIGLDLREGCASVDAGLARPEKVEIGTVQNEDRHERISL
jgi:hypothetical protein